MTKKVFNKLVRDKIPAICEADGSTALTRILSDEEYLSKLTDKLLEEAHEVQAEPCLEELADVMEVVKALGNELGVTMEEIETARQKKSDERGGFEDRIFLISTEPKG
jgi:predicted house-cleaning noncanonical NTP pyrophosphatase (MazG superfamily)